jgi:TPR repeat protein
MRWVNTMRAAVRAMTQRQDYATELHIVKPLADRGDADAQFALGVMYANGRGVPKDDVQAPEWYRKAADQGHADAQFALGVMNDQGRSLGAAIAIRWYRKAADQGHADAQSNLGTMYASGRGVPTDDVQAVKWCRLAADQGAASAQFTLGYMYASGRGVPTDDVQAVKLYRKAADQGHADAQFFLGNMYASGRGVPKDYAQAVKWYRLAADQGKAIAQLELGAMYDDGTDVPKDDVQAAKWYRKAADQGNADAQFALDNLTVKGKSRKHFGDYQMALRQIDTETVRHRPSWLSNSGKEEEFFNVVMMLVCRGSVPVAYAMHGFMSPQSAEVLFSFAANMELQGASFTEQKVATAKFIEQMWAEMVSQDKDEFLRATTAS